MILTEVKWNIEQKTGKSFLCHIQGYIADKLEWRLLYPTADDFLTLMLAFLGITANANAMYYLRKAIDLCIKSLPCHPSTAATVALLVANDSGLLSEYSHLPSMNKLENTLEKLFTKHQSVILALIII